MFKLTRHLMLFALITIAMTIAFHWTLSWLISSEIYGWIWPLAIGYGLLMFFNGLIVGRYDDAYLTRADLGFSYHAMTYFVVVPIWLAFAWSRPEVSTGGKLGETLGALLWGIFLLIHLYFSRRAIKGYNRREVFD